jgi:single-stranded DNA-binding protein
VHLNSCLMIGRVSPRGAHLRYAESGTPFCSFMLEIDEVTDGKVYTTFIPCEITGKYAQQTAIALEPGDVVQISGKWRYKPVVVDQKSGAKISKPVVSSWGVSQRQPALARVDADDTSARAEGETTSEEEIVAPEPTSTNKGRPRYPKWQPTGFVEPN